MASKRPITINAIGFGTHELYITPLSPGNPVERAHKTFKADYLLNFSQRINGPPDGST